jgi:CelD/BcsL family acetyltransferase involved in cellulose biosynthesis
VAVVQGELIDDARALERYREGWDRLAVELSQPYSAPAWALAWWHHAAPPTARLKTIVVREGDELVGIAPLYVDRWAGALRRYSFLAAESCWRVEPLARPGDRERTAEVIADKLSGAQPTPDLLSFRHLPGDSPWPELIARHWPARLRPRLVHESSLPSPHVTLESDDLDAWLATRSRNLRQQIRKKRRTLEQKGAVVSSSASCEGLERDVKAFFALHYDRWEGRGGSWATGRQLEQAVAAAAHELIPKGRFRFAAVRSDDEMVGVAAVIAAGAEAGYWLGGLDRRWTLHSPGLIALVEAIDDGIRRPEKRLDLGPGDEGYKARLADGEDRLHTLSLVPVGARFPWVRLQLGARSLLHRLRALRGPLVDLARRAWPVA